jgi:hypothetical protein
VSPEQPEELTPFQVRLRKRLEERAQQTVETRPAASKAVEPGDDLIPEPRKRLNPDDQQLDELLNGIDILTAYSRWCHKSPIPATRRTEGIKLSCPNPAHPDKHPSAWFNTEKGVWTCGSCNIGGDANDIAALSYGYTIPDYRKTSQFREVRQRMASDLGYVRKSSGGVSWYETPSSTAVENPVENPSTSRTNGHEADLTPSPDLSEPNSCQHMPDMSESTGTETEQTTQTGQSDPAVAEATPDNVVELYEEAPPIVFPGINWRSVVDPDTFLWDYMAATTKDTSPEEYHFWNGLLALGLAVGRDVTLFDLQPVYANLFVCLIGATGEGKSRSRGHLIKLLNQALPYDHKAAISKGVKKVGSPASGEFLIKEFNQPILDHENKPTGLLAPVRGLIEYGEFAALSGRASRMGNTLKTSLMEFYDADEKITTASLTHGRQEAWMAFGSAWTSTQPRALRDLVERGDADSGWLNRWVFAGGIRKQKIAIGGAVVDIAPVVPKLRAIHAWSGKSRVVSWDDDAAEMFTNFFHGIIERDMLSDQTALLQRMDLLMKKLILLFAINRKQDHISLDIVAKVLPLYRYMIECYGIANESIGNTLAHEARAEIKRHIVRLAGKTGRGVSIREIDKCIHRKNYPIRLVREVLAFMVEMGELEVEAPPAGPGRKTTRYHVVD